MRLLRTLVTSLTLAVFPLAIVTGCAGTSNGAALPASPAWASLASPHAPAPYLQSAKKMANWLQFGYDAGHSGYNPLEKTIGAKNIANLQIAWNNQSIIQPNGIAVANGVVYIDDMGQSNEGLYALKASNGKQKWSANLGLNGAWGSFYHAVSVVDGNVVVSPCSNGSTSKFLTGLCGVNANTGKVLWTYYCSQYQGGGCEGMDNGTSPALYNGTVYFQITQGVNEQPDTEAIDPKTGSVVWDDPGQYHCPDAGDTSLNPLPAADGLVFAVSGCATTKGATEICALSATSGTAAWCDGSQSAYVNDLIAGGGQLYVAEPVNSDLDVIAFDEKTGKQDWSQTLTGQNSQAMAYANGMLFIEDGAAVVYGLSAKTGKPKWTYTANGNYFKGGAISVANGLVYVDGGGGNNGNVALATFAEKTGKLVWTSTIGSNLVGNGAAQATPVIVDGTIYAGCYTVCAFKVPKNGDRSR